MNQSKDDKTCDGEQWTLGRREFLILGGSSVTALVLAPAFLSDANAQLVMSSYPDKKIADLKTLMPRKALEFYYPNDRVRNFIVKLGEPAGGGLGPDADVVAFNSVCPHMGGPVGAELYKPEHAVVGPCPLHLTTFDLTRHGMVVSGHATESLPQIALEIRGSAIYAVGIMGLMYGYHVNPNST